MLILLEGLDKVGKSTVAEYFRKAHKAEYLHMSAPAKWHTRESYFAEVLHMIALTAGKNAVIDRTWYGELVWPAIFGRNQILTFADCQALTAVAKQLHCDVQCIYMHDPDEAAHLARIAKFKEPTYDFAKARELYEEMADQGKFRYVTFPEAEMKGWT